jgi:hypothetical protein
MTRPEVPDSSDAQEKLEIKNMPCYMCACRCGI